MTEQKPKFHQTKEFKELNAKWQGKLQKAGFTDIEHDEDHLKTWHASRYATAYRDTAPEIKTEYYRIAGQFLHSYKFTSKTEQRIWELHSEGVSLRNIAKRLSTKRNKLNKDSVHTIIRRLLQEMLKFSQETDL